MAAGPHSSPERMRFFYRSEPKSSGRRKSPERFIGGCVMEKEWMTDGSDWGLRTWITLALLSLLPIGLTAALLCAGS
jgi:hypothetical protein